MDFRKSPAITHMREAAGEGQCMWCMRHQLHFLLSLEWAYLMPLTVGLAVIYCSTFGVLLQLAGALDHQISKEPNAFSPEQNEGLPLYDGYWGYGTAYSSFLKDIFAPTFKGFMLSVQTFLTIGYGVYGPDGICTQVVIIIELGLGLVVTSIVTGLPYLKFSIPYPAFEFSNNMLVTWFNDKPTLQCRFTMKRLDRLTNVRMRMDLMLEHVTLQGVPSFTINEMKLVTQEAAQVVLTATVQHVLTEDSPLFKFWKHQSVYPEKLSPQPFVQVTVSAIDHNYQAEILDTYMYSLADDLKWNHKFKDMIRVVPNEYSLLYDNLHKTEIWPDPETRICDMLHEDDPSKFRYPVLRHAKQFQESLEADIERVSESKTAIETKASQTAARDPQYRRKAKRIPCFQKKDEKVHQFKTVVKNKCLRMVDPEHLYWFALKVNFPVMLLSAFIPLILVSLLMMQALVLFDEGCHGPFKETGQTGVYSADSNCTDVSLIQYYEDMFYFSMQTVSTVGYGSLAPYTTTSQIISSVFGVMGFVVLAIWCGLIFAVYAQPRSTLLISDKACITTRNGQRCGDLSYHII